MLKKKMFEVDQEERQRILSLHESATKKLYLLKEQDYSFSFPALKEGGFGQTTVGLVKGIYSESDGLSVQIQNMTKVFEVPSKNEIESNPNWLVTKVGYVSPYEEWVGPLNKEFMNDNPNLVYVPTYDENNKGLVWVKMGITSKTKRSKKGLAGKIGLGKRYESMTARVLGSIPTNQSIPK